MNGPARLSRRTAIRMGLCTACTPWLAAGMVAPLCGCAARKPLIAPPAPAAPGIGGAGSLRAHAEAQGFLYGCAVSVPALADDSDYKDLVVSQAGIVVAENAMKWAALRPAPGAYRFEEADALLAFAEGHGKKIRGHCLCWYRQLPGWFAGYATTENARGLLTSHIATVAGRYAGRMHSWDVVNEAILLKDGRPDGLRDSPWLRLVGPDYIETAFRAAREADPQALLTYNDYGLEDESAAAEAKRVAVLLLLRRLHARRVPLDALGLQSHLTAGGQYGPGLVRFLESVRELGLQVFITELDVNDHHLPSDAAVRDAAVARTYADYLELVLRERAVRAVLTWGITDRKTWLNHEDARADGLPERCLPFGPSGGKADQPEAAFFAIRKAFDSRNTA